MNCAWWLRWCCQNSKCIVVVHPWKSKSKPDGCSCVRSWCVVIIGGTQLRSVGVFMRRFTRQHVSFSKRLAGLRAAGWSSGVHGETFLRDSTVYLTLKHKQHGGTGCNISIHYFETAWIHHCSLYDVTFSNPTNVFFLRAAIRLLCIYHFFRTLPVFVGVISSMIL